MVSILDKNKQLTEEIKVDIVSYIVIIIVIFDCPIVIQLKTVNCVTMTNMCTHGQLHS